MTPRNVVLERRKALGLTQEQVAERAGMDRPQFNQIERGKRGVGMVVAKRLAAVLGGDTADYVTQPPVPSSRLDELEDRVVTLERGHKALRRRFAAQAKDLREQIASLQDGPAHEADDG